MKLPRGKARNSTVGALILQRKFATVGKSEPIVITNSGVCAAVLHSSSTVQGQGPNLMLWYGICGTDVE
jgi:hypothetical protein